MSQHRSAVSTVAAVADLLDGVSRVADDTARLGAEWDRRRQLRALGRAVRELRARHDLSQEHLGFRCGLHRNYVGAVERGEVNSTFRILILLTAGLDEPLSELIALYERNRHADAARRRSRVQG
jgi:DNA-binding XRE family transcriptional regulator